MIDIKKALLITGIVLILVILIIMVCGGGKSISGEYQFTGWTFPDTRLALTEEGTFDYKAKNLEGEWKVKESGKWEIDNQGKNIYFYINDSVDYIARAAIGDGKITVSTNLKIPIGTWEKVE